MMMIIMTIDMMIHMMIIMMVIIDNHHNDHQAKKIRLSAYPLGALLEHPIDVGPS